MVKNPFSRFKWNRSGYAKLLHTGEIQALVEKPAHAIAEMCNASFTPSKGEPLEGYRAVKLKGKLASGYVVRTTTPHAYRSELKHKRLIRAIQSQRSD